jgi:hypothetical protein
LSPQAAQRLAREAVVQSFDLAARALNEDWGTRYDGTQVQRYAEKLGRWVVQRQQAEVRAYEQGRRPEGPANDPDLLVVGMDGGRWQGREKNPDTGSRWKEDKVLTMTSYRRGDGKDKPPRPLVTSYVATTQDCRAFGRLARVEAERRGIRQARTVLHISDGGNWIDPLHQEQFFRHERILDYYHAVEHLYQVARAVHPQNEGSRQELGQQLERWLWRGQVQGVLKVLGAWAQTLGPPQEGDSPEHPRRVISQNVGYFTKHREHVNYPAYRARGWPIGSGPTEAGVKLMNKRIKGTEQFWRPEGAEAILALRALWVSQDERWPHYWWYGRLLREAA